MRILNKVVRITDGGIELEADPRHAELVIKELGLEDAKPSAVPGSKVESKSKSTDAEMEKVARSRSAQKRMEVEKQMDSIESATTSMKGENWNSELSDELEVKDDDDGDEELDAAGARRYRAVAARLSYISPDRPDIGFATKEAARNMSKPRASDLRKLRKIGRYLIGRPRLILSFPWQNVQDRIVAFTDSDWAGCAASAKSTSGGAVCLGEHVLKTYCKQQKVIALSSAEAELYAMVSASAEAIAIAAYARDLGMDLGIEMYCDSAAALGITNRAGIGKVRHLRTQGLWVQEARVSGRIEYKKVLGEKNPADLLTKHLGADVTAKHIETLNMRWTGGRAETAPTLSSVESLISAWYEDYIQEGQIDDAKEEAIDVIQEETGVERHEESGDDHIIKMKSCIKKKFGRSLTVTFSDRVTIRPIEATGKCRPTPRRGTSGEKRARWPGDRSRGEVNLKEENVEVSTVDRSKCDCGELMRRGDGRKWGDEEPQGFCEPCASNWRSLEPSDWKGIERDAACIDVDRDTNTRVLVNAADHSRHECRRGDLGVGNGGRSRRGYSRLLERRNSIAEPPDLVQLVSTPLQGRYVEGGALGGGGPERHVSSREHVHAWAGSMHMRVQGRACVHCHASTHARQSAGARFSVAPGSSAIESLRFKSVLLFAVRVRVLLGFLPIHSTW